VRGNVLTPPSHHRVEPVSMFPMGILPVLALILWLAGCAGTSVLDAVDEGSIAAPALSMPAPVQLAEARDVSLSDLPMAAAKTPPLGTHADELFDPFAKGDEEGEEYDPWESLNTKIFEFNRQMDKYVLKPVAQGYDFIMPDFVQVGISNVFYNLRFPQRFLNNVFQGKVKGAGVEVGRFLLNTTVGYAGFIDLAKEIDLVTPDEDFGQTLGYYGVKPGPYLVLPFLQPFTVRDFAGYVTDIFLNPINWLVAPIIEVEGVPSLIAHKNRTTTTFVQIGSRVGEIINERSRNLEKFQGVEEATLDLYTAVRNAYLQSRARAIRE
jgi:phospholipid-binding lipoprotein MlaA